MNTQLSTTSKLIINLDALCILRNVDGCMISMGFIRVLAILIEGRDGGSRLNAQISAHRCALPPFAGVRRTGTMLYQGNTLTIADKFPQMKGHMFFLTHIRHI